MRSQQVRRSSAQEVESKEQSRLLERQPLYTACGGVNTLKKGVERELTSEFDHQLSVKKKSLFRQYGRRLSHLGKIAGEVLTRFRSHGDALSIALKQATEAVPFRLVLPLFSARDYSHRTRLHWFDSGGRCFCRCRSRRVKGCTFVDCFHDRLRRPTGFRASIIS